MEEKAATKITLVSDLPIGGAIDELTPAENELSVHETPIFYDGNESPYSSKLYAHNGETIDELMGKPRPKDDEAFVIIQDGGVGDAICATPMIKAAKKFYPDKKIIVGSAHADILRGNPDIDRLYHLGAPTDLFNRWVKPLRHFGSVIKRDIYNASAHKLFPGPLSMIWCHLYGVPYDGDDVKVYLSDEEIDEAKMFISSFKRPVVAVHGTGAKLLFNPAVQITPNKDWFPEYWAEIVKILREDFDVIQFGGPQEMEIPGVTTYLLGRTSIRQTAALLTQCLTFVSIDSFVGHCAPAVGTRGVVLFGRSNPYIAGHTTNKNVWVNDSCKENDMFCGRPQGYFGDSELFEGQLRPWVCPHRSCMRAIKPSMVMKVVYDLIGEIKASKMEDTKK